MRFLIKLSLMLFASAPLVVSTIQMKMY